MSNLISDIATPFVPAGTTVRDRFLDKIKFVSPNTVPNSLRVFLIREPFDDFYLLVLDDGRSEELEDAGVRQWCADRGADPKVVQKAITQAWNFYSACFLIRNPRTPPRVFDPVAPRIE